MIIDKKLAKKIYIPRGSIESISFSTFKFILYSDSTTEDYTFYVEDIERLYDYFKFEVDLKDVKTGDYEWHLHPYARDYDTEYTYNCISKGIIKIVEGEQEQPEYFEDNEDKIIYYE